MRGGPPDGQKFCDHCGAELAAAVERAESAEAAEPQPQQAPPPEHLARKIRAGAESLEGERKQVTVLFADVMGSMELAESSDLVEGYVALEDLGEFDVKGASKPLRVHELTGVGAARSRLDVSRARGFSRFVGRDDEMKTLTDALERARGGDAQVIGVVGDAGVGKSRLCHEFTEQARAGGIPIYHAAADRPVAKVPSREASDLLDRCERRPLGRRRSSA